MTLQTYLVSLTANQITQCDLEELNFERGLSNLRVDYNITKCLKKEVK